MARRRPRPDRAEPDRPAPHRDRPDGAVQLPVRPPHRRHVHPPARGHRRGPQLDRPTSRTSSTASTGSGITWDEGPEVAGEAARGPYAPYRQMARLPIYARGRRAAARRGHGLSLLLHARGARRRPEARRRPSKLPPRYVGRCATLTPRRARRARGRGPPAARSGSASARASSPSTTSSAAGSRSTRQPRRRLRHRPGRRHAALPLHGRRRRRGDADQPRDPRRGPPLEHAQAHPAVPGARLPDAACSPTCR